MTSNGKRALTPSAKRILKSQLWGVSASDLGTFVFAPLATGLLACYIPARRAPKVDLMFALRHE